MPIPKVPVTLKGHLGYTDGSLGLANLVSGNKHYLDWSVNAEVSAGPVKVGVSYVDTDITNNKFGTAFPRGYAQTLHFGSTVLGYISASF